VRFVLRIMRFGHQSLTIIVHFVLILVSAVDPASLAYGSAAAFKSLRKVPQWHFLIAHKYKNRQLAVFWWPRVTNYNSSLRSYSSKYSRPRLDCSSRLERREEHVSASHIGTEAKQFASYNKKQFSSENCFLLYLCAR